MAMVYQSPVPGHANYQNSVFLPSNGTVVVTTVYSSVPCQSSVVTSAAARSVWSQRYPAVEVSTQVGGTLSPRMPPAAESQPLATVSESSAGTGMWVFMGGHTFECMRELGHGSSGTVWEAQDFGSADHADAKDRPLYALKSSVSRTQEFFKGSLFEAEVLEKLTAALPADSEAGRRVPRYVAHGVAPTTVTTQSGHTGCLESGAGRNHVLLAMTKLRGQPLDEWLYGVDVERQKTIPASVLLDGPLPGSHFATCEFAEACSIATTLLSQMAPVLSEMSKIACHRDVSGHNILIDGEAGSLEFAILDFGFAVSAQSWPQDWPDQNISGDPRYWSPAALMLAVHGTRYLEEHQDPLFRQQYEHRIDHYAFGVLLLEVLFALWKGPSAESEKPLVEVHAAWRAYWACALDLFQSFHRRLLDDANPPIAQPEALAELVDKLTHLCSTLRAAALFSNDYATSTLFQIAVGLLDWHSSLAWEELPGMLAGGPSTAVGLRNEHGFFENLSVMLQRLSCVVATQQQGMAKSRRSNFRSGCGDHGPRKHRSSCAN
mmetsp:Transcript_111805/g.316547  ORF Transcript_111805/g.316547 Transcript_111805/m.316547 type:complete len:547 (-) Transcript_111805:127-1767(-)